MTLESFIAEIDAFCKSSSMSATDFGKAAVNDPSFVGDLRAGRAPGLRLVQKVHKFIEDNGGTVPLAPVAGSDSEKARADR